MSNPRETVKARQYRSTDTVDFVIAGSGAAGGVIARELSQAGFSVVVLEQGPRLGPGDFEHDDLRYNCLSGIANNPAQSPQTSSGDWRKARRFYGRAGRRSPRTLLTICSHRVQDRNAPTIDANQRQA